MKVGRGQAWRFAAAGAGGVLLAVAFPPVGASEVAWFALVPLIIVARYTRPRAAFRYGFAGGLVFWVLTLVWLRRLAAYDTPWLAVISAWFLLAAACAVYTGAFVSTIAMLWSGDGGAGERVSAAGAGRIPAIQNVGRMAAVALAWVGFEYLRGTLFTGFTWNGLGVTQYRNLPLIQVADVGGVYAVSAVVAMVNAGMALTAIELARTLRRQGGVTRRFHPELLASLLVLALALMYGVHRLQDFRILDARTPLTPLRCAIIQGNVSQDEKWSEEVALAVQQKLTDLTERAVIMEPELTIWPETSVPWPLSLADAAPTFLNELASGVGPLLVGAIEADEANSTPRYYNSAFLYGADGAVAGTYRKQHLVPFGEYIPLGTWIPFLERFAPLGYSCAAGSTGTVFRLTKPAVPFAALICFEDTIAPVARQAVRNGARLLINQTNDAWFYATCAAVQHLSQCVFRCVENRVPEVRCANMGISGVVDRTGALDASTSAALARGETPDTLFRVDSVGVPVASYSSTFYTRHGDLPFALPCGVLSAAALAGGWWNGRRRRGAPMA
ncbi:MAG: apolipoprotein N-acyltransferase [Lentisphaerae bacterium]|nr:apolipoprotein N-acyltransferase [Lentisphaerota bacterium]